MYEILLHVIAIALVLIFTGSVWFLVCNDRTAKERIAIITWVFENNATWRERNRVYEAVSYEQHLFALFMCRDAMTLYKFENIG